MIGLMKWISQEIIILDATDFDVLNEKARVLLEEQRRLKDIESKRSKIPESEAHIAGVSTRQFRKN